jgi:Bacterial Ig-like domain (group 3)
VTQRASGGASIPTGTVQFTIDGSKTGDSLKLDEKGQATLKTSRLKVGTRQVAAHYIPTRNSVFLPSSSFDKPHIVVDREARK